jgi:hypothetical protein
MDKIYKILLSTYSFFLVTAFCFGQSGIVRTERELISVVSFSAESKLTGINDTKHVDGYVKKYGASRFVFPVGQNGSYRPFAAEADGIMGAYFKSSAGSATLPAGAPFALTAKDGLLGNMNAKEYWDVNGTNASKLTFSWNVASDVAGLTSNSLSFLTIAGWNAATNRWEKIASTVDQVALLGGASTLNSGSISTVEKVIPDKYKAFTLAASTSPVLPASYAGVLEVAGCTEITGWVWDKNYPNSVATVELIEGTAVLATTTADLYREDLKTGGVGTGKYGFRMLLPTSFLSDGITHQVSVRVRNSQYLLGGSPKPVNCSYGGNFEGTDCYALTGWAWDKNNPLTSHTIELVENEKILALTSASIYRESLKNAGYGTGNYGFNVSLAETLRDGKSHQLSARIKGLNFALPGSPKTFTCPVSQYQGNLDLVDCNSVVGWVWNKSYPNSAETVELVEGNTVYATFVANIYNAKVKESGFGTGNYGFKIALPAVLRDGKTHQLSIRVKGSTAILSTRTITCAINQYQGNLDMADCNTVMGWVWDRNFPDSAVTVELVEGSTVYATSVANIYNAKVKESGFGTGYYGFKFALPGVLRDGKAHQLGIRAKGSTTILSTRTITCAINQYQGNLDMADCNTVMGWVWDRNFPDSAVTVELVEGSTVYATSVANIYNAKVKESGFGTGYYGFKIALPGVLRDGKTHQLGIRAKGSTTILSTRTITCAINQYQGNLDMADCNTVMGWVWDRNFPDSAVTVELVEGSTVYATSVANIYNAKVKESGFGTGYYGFKIALPGVLRDGKAHQLGIRAKGSTTILSTRTITCAINQYQGNFEYAGCNVVSGWAWDKNHPETALTVEVIENNVVQATFLANIYKESVKNAGFGTGIYGFTIPTPGFLKDNKPHQLSVRVKGSTFILNNSPRTITCPSPVRLAAARDSLIEYDSTNPEQEVKDTSIELSVAPNPTSGNIKVKLRSGSKKMAQLSIVNLNGQTIWSQSVEGIAEVLTFDIELGKQPAGVYILKMQCVDKTETRRIVLIR